MGYVVSTPVFEGPVDLLLHLVTSHHVDVLDVPLAPVVDAFLAELTERSEQLGMDVLSEFLLVAAVLVELKSQRLLPGPDDVEGDEEVLAWEERDLLLARLLECRAYAGIADVFVSMIEAASRSVPREVGLDEGFSVHAPDLLVGVSGDHLAQAYLRATAERPAPRVDLSHVTVEAVSVSETVHALVALLPTRGPTSFRDLTRGLSTRMEIIVHFLALLELCKRGRVSLGQGETFGDLHVAWITERGPLVGALVSGGHVDGDGAVDTGDGDEYDG
ncbi:MAG: segregation and condensation protein A [Acidimicrobiales bacterium]